MNVLNKNKKKRIFKDWEINERYVLDIIINDRDNIKMKERF